MSDKTIYKYPHIKKNKQKGDEIDDHKKGIRKGQRKDFGLL